MSSSLPYTLALRTFHCDHGLPFTEAGWKQARAVLKNIYGSTAKASDKADSLNGWQAALKEAGRRLKGTPGLTAKKISEEAQKLYQADPNRTLAQVKAARRPEDAYTQERVREWIKSNYGTNAPYIKLDDALYVMLRHMNETSAEYVLERYIKPMIDEILNTGITVRPPIGSFGPARKGAFLSANLYVEGLRNRRRVGPNGQKMTLNPHTKVYKQRVGPRYPRKNPGGAAYPEAAGHTYGKDKRYLVASTKKKEKKKTEKALGKMTAQFQAGLDATMARLAQQAANAPPTPAVPTTRRKRARVDITSRDAMDVSIPLSPSGFGPAPVRPFPANSGFSALAPGI